MKVRKLLALGLLVCGLTYTGIADAANWQFLTEYTTAGKGITTTYHGYIDMESLALINNDACRLNVLTERSFGPYHPPKEGLVYEYVYVRSRNQLMFADSYYDNSPRGFTDPITEKAKEVARRFMLEHSLATSSTNITKPEELNYAWIKSTGTVGYFYDAKKLKVNKAKKTVTVDACVWETGKDAYTILSGWTFDYNTKTSLLSKYTKIGISDGKVIEAKKGKFGQVPFNSDEDNKVFEEFLAKFVK